MCVKQFVHFPRASNNSIIVQNNNNKIKLRREKEFWMKFRTHAQSIIIRVNSIKFNIFFNNYSINFIVI